MSAAARGAQFALVSVGGAVRAADLQTRREPRAVGRALAAWAAPQHAADLAGATLHAVARLCGHRMRVWAGVLGPGLGLLARGRPWIGELGIWMHFCFFFGGLLGCGSGRPAAAQAPARSVSDSPRLPGPPWRRHSRCGGAGIPTYSGFPWPSSSWTPTLHPQEVLLWVNTLQGPITATGEKNKTKP